MQCNHDFQKINQLIDIYGLDMINMVCIYCGQVRLVDAHGNITVRQAKGTVSYDHEDEKPKVV